MNVVLSLVGVSIGGAFLVAGLSRSRRSATIVDALLMLVVTTVVWLVAYAPTFALQIFGESATWASTSGDPPPTLAIATVTALVATVFSVRTAIAGESNLLFGAISIWGNVTLIAVAPDVTTTFLAMQMATWLAWFEIGRRDPQPDRHAGLRGLLFTIAADLPLAFIAIMIALRTGALPWETLEILVAEMGANRPTDGQLQFLVISLICSASVRLAQFPLGSWLPRSVETSRVGRAFSTTLLSIPVGIVLLERATSLWSLSPVGRLLVANAAPIAVVAAVIVSLGQTRRSAALAVSVTAMLGVAAACSTVKEPVISSWALLVLAAAMIRPTRSRTGRAICTVGFAVFFLVAVAPLVASYEELLVSGIGNAAVSRQWLLEAVCLLSVFAVGAAVARPTDPVQLRDEVTQPIWPSLTFLAAGIFLLTATEGGRSDRVGFTNGIVGLGIGRDVLIAFAFLAGVWRARRDKRIAPSASPDEPSTLMRLSQTYFYVDEIIFWCVALPTKAIAFVVQGVDWLLSRVVLPLLTTRVLRHLDTESRLIDDRPTPVGIGLLAIVLSLVVFCLSRAA